MEKAFHTSYDNTFALQCRCAARAGFTAIEIGQTKLVNKTNAEWDAATEHMLSVMEENGLHCVQIHLPYYDLLQSSEIPDPPIDFATRQSIVSAGRLGARFCAFHSRTSISSGYRSSCSFEDNRRILSDYLDIAIASNTAIAVENLPIFHSPATQREMMFYSCAFEDLATLVDSFSDDHMGICWDFGHANLMDWEQQTAITFLGKRIFCTHIHNNFGKCDDHFSPDHGNIAWSTVMQTLAKIGYRGPLTLESIPKYADDEALLTSFARHNLACLDYLETLLEHTR